MEMNIAGADFEPHLDYTQTNQDLLEEIQPLAIAATITHYYRFKAIVPSNILVWVPHPQCGGVSARIFLLVLFCLFLFCLFIGLFLFCLFASCVCVVCV